MKKIEKESYFSAYISKKFRGISRKLKLAFTVAVMMIIAKKMQSQESSEHAPNTYNSITAQMDYRGPASEIADNVKDRDVLVVDGFRQHEGTQFLNFYTTLNGNAPIPDSVMNAGDLGFVNSNYRKWVQNLAPYDQDNGRPNSSDSKTIYALQSDIDIPGNAIGNAAGGGNNYGTVAYDLRATEPTVTGSNIVTQQETVFPLGVFTSNASSFPAESDLFNDGNFTFDETIKSAVSNGDIPGTWSRIMAASADKRTDLTLDDDGVWRVYNTRLSGGYTANFRALPEDVAVTNTPGALPSLDQLHANTRIGGSREAWVKQLAVPADIDIQFKTTKIEKNGNIVTFPNLAADKIAVDNPYSGIPDKIEVFAYCNGCPAGDQTPRMINGIERPMVGFTIDPANPSIDLTYFLNNNPTSSDIDDFDFRIRNTSQNGMSQVLNEVTLGIGSENQEVEGFSVYPNPATDTVYLRSNEPLNNVLVYDIQGRLIEGLSRNEYREIDVSGLAKGVYAIKAFGQNGKFSSTKFIKN